MDGVFSRWDVLDAERDAHITAIRLHATSLCAVGIEKRWDALLGAPHRPFVAGAKRRCHALRFCVAFNLSQLRTVPTSGTGRKSPG